MARKKTFLLNHELIDGIRFLDPAQFKAIICGLADIDEHMEPETKDPVALAFINMQKGFILENAEKWEKKCADMKSARQKRAGLASSGSTEINTENPEINTEISTENPEINTEISSVSVTDPVTDPVSVSVSENDPVSETGAKAPENEREKNKAYFIKQWQSHPDIFNPISRIHNPNDFDYWWQNSNITRKEIDIAIKNVVDGVKNGLIERRYIPGSPDKFIINGWIQRSQEPFVKKSGPSPPKKEHWDHGFDISQPKEVI
jgi:hypothetical protein